MPEVGLLPFARVALQVSTAVLPTYRTRFSKHQFTQPQLRAALCLMRYEDWTFREAEVRLREHSELRRVPGLKSVPDYTTLYRFLKRLDPKKIDDAVREAAWRLVGKRPRRRRGVRVAVDATGLSPGAISTFFVRRMHHHTQKPLPWRHWLKWLLVADLDEQVILAQSARTGPWNDCANLPALVGSASRVAQIGLVLADAEFDSERNHRYIRGQLGAQSVIPARRGKRTWRIHGVRAEMRREFPRRQYSRRALIETAISVVKRKLSARAPGRTLFTQMRQALLLGLAFNIYKLRHPLVSPGCQQSQIASSISLASEVRERAPSLENGGAHADGTTETAPAVGSGGERTTPGRLFFAHLASRTCAAGANHLVECFGDE